MFDDYEFTLWVFDGRDFWLSLFLIVAGAFLVGFLPSITIKYLAHRLEVNHARAAKPVRRRRRNG